MLLRLWFLWLFEADFGYIDAVVSIPLGDGLIGL